MLCKISGKIEMSHHIFVVAFDMRKAKKSPARGGAIRRMQFILIQPFLWLFQVTCNNVHLRVLDRTKAILSSH